MSAVKVTMSLEQTQAVATAGLIRATRYTAQFEGKTSHPNFGVKNRGLNWFEFVTAQCEALAGELAVANYTKNPITDLANRNGSLIADVGRNIEVKFTSHQNGHLIVDEASNDDDVAVLVMGRNPHYYLIGWMPVKMAKVAKYRHSHRHGYWVAQSNLFEMENLERSNYGKN